MTHKTAIRSNLFSTIGETYRLIYRWRGDLLRLIWPFVLLEFIYLWARFIASGGPQHDETSAISIIYLCLAFVTIIPLAARLHQFALFPGPVDNWPQRRISRRNLLWARTFGIWCLPLMLTVVLASALMMLTSNPAVHGVTTTNAAIGLVMTLILSVIVVRLILVFPLAFDSGVIDLSKAWRMSRGHYLFLFLLFAFSTVPFRLIYRLCDLVGQKVWLDPALPVASKLAFYFFVVFLPSTLAIVAQMIVLVVAVTLVYQQITAAQKIRQSSLGT